jgi:hypothetical protein
MDFISDETRYNISKRRETYKDYTGIHVIQAIFLPW